MSKGTLNPLTVSAPARVDLSGGATDWCGLNTLSLAINLRASATLEKISDPGLVMIASGGFEEQYREPSYGTSLDLFKAVIELGGLKGFKITYKTEIPKHSSLGGSAPLAVSTLFGLKHLFGKNWSLYYIAELAQRAESLKLKTVNGYQDQYLAAFGGCKFMDFRGKECQVGNYSRPIEQEPYAVVEDLSGYLPDFKFLVACPKILDVTSNQANAMVSRRYLEGDREIVGLIKKKAALTQGLKKAIIEGQKAKVVEIVNENQKIMRKFGWVSADNERILKEAFKLGALAVKNTGAGFAAMVAVCENETGRDRVAEGLKGVAEHIFKVEIAGGVRVESDYG